MCSRAVVTVAAEQHWRFGRMDLLSSEQAGWRLKPFNSCRSVFWLLTMQWWDWRPSLKCCCWTDVKPRSHLPISGCNRSCKSQDRRNGKPNLSGFACRCFEPDRHKLTASVPWGSDRGTVCMLETLPRSWSLRIALCTQLSCPFQPGNRTYY